LFIAPLTIRVSFLSWIAIFFGCPSLDFVVSLMTRTKNSEDRFASTICYMHHPRSGHCPKPDYSSSDQIMLRKTAHKIPNLWAFLFQQKLLCGSSLRAKKDEIANVDILATILLQCRGTYQAKRFGREASHHLVRTVLKFLPMGRAELPFFVHLHHSLSHSPWYGSFF
jgi:hypothetical protein